VGIRIKETAYVLRYFQQQSFQLGALSKSRAVVEVIEVVEDHLASANRIYVSLIHGSP
jgi:hypothetical protein